MFQILKKFLGCWCILWVYEVGQVEMTTLSSINHVPCTITIAVITELLFHGIKSQWPSTFKLIVQGTARFEITALHMVDLSLCQVKLFYDADGLEDILREETFGYKVGAV